MLPHFEVIEVDRCFYLTFEVDNLIKNQTERKEWPNHENNGSIVLEQ